MRDLFSKMTEATYAKKIEKFEAKLNWKEKAENLVAKINALHPNPGSLV